MENTLKVFSAITTHLVSLTGRNEYNKPKSKGIQTYEDLAHELNEQGIFTTRNTQWTANSLKKFCSRCRHNYPLEELKQLCPLELVGAQHHEFVAKNNRLKAGKIIRFKQSLYPKKFLRNDTV